MLKSGARGREGGWAGQGPRVLGPCAGPLRSQSSSVCTSDFSQKVASRKVSLF